MSNERYWIEHEENRSNEIYSTEPFSKNKEKYLKELGFAWKQLGVTLMKLIATLAFCGCCLYIMFHLISLTVSHLWNDWNTTIKEKESQANSYPYQAIILGDTGKYLASYPKCYTTEHYLACETHDGVKEIVEDYWEK